MEALLSLSFDNISSKNVNKIRKGLRQIEGLLAQICLPNTRSLSPSKRLSSVPREATVEPTKTLSVLAEDPAFREFFRLQESFEWNVATRLIECLERLLGKGSNGENDLAIVSALGLLQGILLLHPPSRSLFGREIHMNLLLDLLDPSNCPAILSSSVLALIGALLDTPNSIRTFENMDGLLTINSLFKMRSTPQAVKLRVIEFLYFYLMPETPSGAGHSSPGTPKLHRSPNKLISSSLRSFASGSSDGDVMTKSVQDKRLLLEKYLGNVEDLVQDMRNSTPFGVPASAA